MRDESPAQAFFGGLGELAVREGSEMKARKPVRVAKSKGNHSNEVPMNPSNRDPAAIAAAFERANAIVALEGFVPDERCRAIQRRVTAGELTSDQAVQLVIAQAQAADRALATSAAKAA